MRKTTLLLALIACLCILPGCTKSEPTHEQYTTQGRYHTTGYVLTDNNDGTWECWIYQTDIISDQKVYDDMPVNVLFDDNGTPEYIYDDIVLGCTYDMTTAIYDELEDALSESFELERDGNNIRVVGYTHEQ